ncbi:ferritin [Sulfurimonas sp.]|uniref:ferritin n=1 Tax=Sulfurimonas sp. TaxID=2022749 RepID=UPI002AB1FDB0|nr:ferritin [Sulfurimonas sp.]
MISKKMTKALSLQLNREFYSAYLYLSMSAYCNHIDFNGAANWFKMQYEEEHMHATKIYNYLTEQGVHVNLEQIDKPPRKFGTILEIFQQSLDHEKFMTKNLNNLSDKALKVKDHATYNLLQWFVNEQVEEEASVEEIISKIKLVKNSGYGLLMVDNELAQRAAPEAKL